MQTPVTVPIIHYDCPPGQRKPAVLEPVDLKPAPGTLMGMAVSPRLAQAVNKPNIVFAHNLAEARRLVAFMGLREADWEPASIGCGTLGRRYQKALVLWSGGLQSIKLDQASEWLNAVVKTAADEVLVL